jgi:hypothetical protein
MAKQTLTDSQKDLVAIVGAALEEHTPPLGNPADSAERMREVAGEVFDERISGHELKCRTPGGGICGVEEKVDKVLETLAEKRGSDRVWAIGRAAGGAIALAVLGVSLNYFADKRAETNTRATVEAAAEVAKQLKAVQDAARNGHTMLPPATETGVRFANNITGGTP